MKDLKDISMITYTNHVMQDAWDMYFGQLDKFSNIKSYVFSDIDCEDYKNHRFITYNNEDPYYKQYLESIENVEEDFVIYMQEDFFLYDKIDEKAIIDAKKFLKNSNYSFVRLIRAGYKTPTSNKVHNSYYEIDVKTNDAFSMQATLWKKSKLKELYLNTKSKMWYEGEEWNQSCRDLDITGVFAYNGEDQRGRFHYDSSIFPYTCTGINKGYWNIQLYGQFLASAFKEYNTDLTKRGVRLSDNQFVPPGKIEFKTV